MLLYCGGPLSIVDLPGLAFLACGSGYGSMRTANPSLPWGRRGRIGADVSAGECRACVRDLVGAPRLERRNAAGRSRQSSRHIVQ